MTNVYILLGTTESEATDAMKAQVEAIHEIVKARLIGKLTVMLQTDVTEVPAELDGIVTEVCVNRYNRIGSEGAGSHTVDGESYSWADEDYFSPYEKDIAAYVNAQQSKQTDGRLKFL